jgi:hypothetical protein
MASNIALEVLRSEWRFVNLKIERDEKAWLNIQFGDLDVCTITSTGV